MRTLFVGIIAVVSLILLGANSHAASYQMHTVRANESYFKIAANYGADMKELQSLNNQLEETLMIGDLVKIKTIQDIKVKVNGVNIPFDADPYIENGRVFVPIRFVSEALNSDSISWDQNTKRATVKFEGKTVIVRAESSTALVNGQVVELDAPVQLYDSRTFVPVRFFSEVVGADSIKWDQTTYTVLIEKQGLVVDMDNITPAYSEEDLYWLSRLVEAESKGEPFEGKVAVANTVINRLDSPDFPDTIKEIIFDTKFGVQYSPVRNGSIYNTPSQDSINAAKKALEGYKVAGDSIYFLNPAIAESSWIQANRTYYKTIENHEFYL